MAHSQHYIICLICNITTVQRALELAQFCWSKVNYKAITVRHLIVGVKGGQMVFQ